MLFDERTKISDQFFEDCKAILLKKGKDYSPEHHALGDFYAIANEIGSTPEKVIWVYLRKQLAAVKRFISKGAIESEPIESRLKDVVNYTVLLYCIVQDKKNVHS